MRPGNPWAGLSCAAHSAPRRKALGDGTDLPARPDRHARSHRQNRFAGEWSISASQVVADDVRAFYDGIRDDGAGSLLVIPLRCDPNRGLGLGLLGSDMKREQFDAFLAEKAIVLTMAVLYSDLRMVALSRAELHWAKLGPPRDPMLGVADFGLEERGDRPTYGNYRAHGATAFGLGQEKTRRRDPRTSVGEGLDVSADLLLGTGSIEGSRQSRMGS